MCVVGIYININLLYVFMCQITKLHAVTGYFYLEHANLNVF